MAAVTALPWLLVMGALWQMHTHSLSACEKHTTQRFKTHTNMCTYTQRVFHFASTVLRLLTSSLAPVISPAHCPATGDRQTSEVANNIRPSDHIKSFTQSNSIFLFPALSVSAFLCVNKTDRTLIAVPLFLPPEHSGRGKVHPGSNEPHARPECLLQPIPWDGLRQA